MDRTHFECGREIIVSMNNKIKKIAISGVGGFLGGKLLETPKIERFEIVALTSQVELCREKFAHQTNISFYRSNDLREIPWNEIDVLINCAFPCNSNGAELASGLQYIERLLDLAVKCGVKSLINISSQSVYSPKRLYAASERELLSLESCYAVGKYASELLTDILSGNIPHTNLRIGNLVGVNSEQRILNRFVSQVLEGKSIHIWNTNRYFDYLDVRDAANAILQVAVCDAETWQPVFNLGAGKTYSILELAQYVNEIAEIVGIRPVDICIEDNADNGERGNSGVLCDAFFRQFGWKPSYSIRNTIESIFAAKMNWGGVIYRLNSEDKYGESLLKRWAA